MALDRQTKEEIAALQRVIAELFGATMRARAWEAERGLYLGAAQRLHQRCQMLERPIDIDGPTVHERPSTRD